MKGAGRILLTLLLLVWAYIGQAQLNNVRFARIGVREGLSQGTVFAICQDYQGFMWIGTRDGLNKYDAINFSVYRNSPSDSSSLSDNYVSALFEDSRRRLWIGTSGGICLYNRDKDNFKRFSLAKIQSGNNASEPLIYTIIEDKKGRIWFGSSRGLYRLKEGNAPALELVFDAGMLNKAGITPGVNNVQSVSEDSSGLFWIGTTSGVLGFARSSAGRLMLKYHFKKEHPNELNCNDIRFVQELKQDILWIGTKTGGINVYNKKTGKFSYITAEAAKYNSIASNDVRSMLKDRFGGIWIGTLNGLNYYTEKNGFITFSTVDHDVYSLSNNSIRPIFQDRRGSVWFGTYYGGISIFDRHIPKFKNYSHNVYTNSLSYNVISGILADKQQNLWIGTEGGGLNYFDTKKNYFTHYRNQPDDPSSISHNNVKSVYLDSEGNLWAGTYTGGLNLLERGSKKFRHYVHEPTNPNSLSNNSVYAIDEDKYGNLWVGTYGGGVNLKRKNQENYFEIYSAEKTEKYHISSNFVRALFVDSKNNIWVGTQNGLNLMRNGSDHFEVFKFSLKDDKSISGNIIISIFEDKHGNIWLGTFKDGLNRFNPKDNSFTRFGTAEGLPGNNIFGILEDGDSHLWLSTNNGICRFDPKTGAVKTYSTKDGINGNEFAIGAYCKMNSGALYFGGPHGLTSFHPDSLSVSSYIPPVVFSGFKLFNKTVVSGKSGVLEKPISITRAITLTHDQNIFTVNFSVLNYILPEKNQYAYMLEGLEKEWNYVSVPSATYTNLNAGTYTLLVKGSSNDGVWNPVPARLTIKVLPPPWKTWWAYLIYSSLIAGAVYMVIRFTRIRSKLEHELQLEHLEKERQQEINEIKLNFFTSISHEFRTPLTLIMSPIQRVLSMPDLNEDIKAGMKTVKSNAGRLLRLVNQLLDFRKQESGSMQLNVSPADISVFIEEIVESFSQYAEEKGIKLKYQKPHTPAMVWFDAEQLEKVIFNLLANAFKFTPEGGCIQLYMNENGPSEKYPEGSIAVNIRDNGKGIPQEKLTAVFEWYYQLHNISEKDKNSFSTGIGLALSKNLVNLHGGELYVESNLGKGTPVFTCFTAELPLGKSHFEAGHLNAVISGEQPLMQIQHQLNINSLNQETIPETAEEEGEISSNKPVIVLVEDNAEVRHEVIQILRGRYSIHEASNGLEGWDLVQRYLPDLVVTDVMMPECDGMSLLKLIKEDVKTNHIPVLLLTARTSASDMISGLQTGSDDYITKPFHADVLQLKIYNILESRERFRRKFIREYILEPQKEETASAAKDFLQKVIGIIEENISETDFNVNTLARELGFSRPVLYRKLKQLTDLSVIELINFIRLRKAAQMLSSGDITVSEVAYRVGFNDPKYFGKSFKAHFGKSPSEYAALKPSLNPIAADILSMENRLN